MNETGDGYDYDFGDDAPGVPNEDGESWGDAAARLRGETIDWSDVRPLPPSSKLVAKTLQYLGPMDQPELAERTLLPQRTVRYALERLENDTDVLAWRWKAGDARQRVYWVEDGGNGDGGSA